VSELTGHVGLSFHVDDQFSCPDVRHDHHASTGFPNSQGSKNLAGGPDP
jgi:hypothetical protein